MVNENIQSLKNRHGEIVEPVFTIITSTFNAGKALRYTADSLRSQTYQNFQWIIADGGSTDDTLTIVSENSDLIDLWFSSPDNGIYDAWNKALPFIKGKWVQFLGAGDEYASPDTLQNVYSELLFVHSNTKITYGITEYIDEATRLSKGYSGKEWGEMKTSWDGLRPSLPSHPSVFHHSSIFDSYRFNTNYRIAADSHLLLESLKTTEPHYLPFIIDRMPLGGVSGKISSTLKYNKELLLICEELGIYIPIRIKLRSLFVNSIKLLLIKAFGNSRTGAIFNIVYKCIGKAPVW